MTRSAKGVEVNFDLLKIKQQIASNPAPVNVREREEFVDNKIRRRARKQKVTPTQLDVSVKPEIVAEQEADELEVEGEEAVVKEPAAPKTTTTKKRPARKQ